MQTETTVYTEPVHLFEDDLTHYQDASLGQRFLNFLVDNLLMQYGLSYITGTAIGFALVALAPETAQALFADADETSLLFLGYAIALFNYLVYYTFCEKVFNGITLGKLITGTRAIRNDGEVLTFKDALYRSLSRMVPFEAFSAFGQAPWHDSWTNTTVVKTR